MDRIFSGVHYEHVSVGSVHSTQALALASRSLTIRYTPRLIGRNLPITHPGSLGDYLQRGASDEEKANVARMLTALNALGLENTGRGATIKLGNNLTVGLDFNVGRVTENIMQTYEKYL